MGLPVSGWAVGKTDIYIDISENLISISPLRSPPLDNLWVVVKTSYLISIFMITLRIFCLDLLLDEEMAGTEASKGHTASMAV